MCGCALRKKADGTYTGHRLATYDYTGCWVHTMGQYYDVHVPAQIQRAKTDTSRGWVEGVRSADGPIYVGDPVTRVKGLKECG